jgi:hypothetical protein
MPKSRNIFPLGNKAFVCYEDVEQLERIGKTIFLESKRYEFDNVQDACSAMEGIFEMYDAEQQLRHA